MSYCDLLERMMQKDTDAFLEMTDRYGWTLYSEIRKKYPNKAEADRIYNETMQYVYSCMQNPACEDPMEAILYAFAAKIAEKGGLREDPFSRMNPDALTQPPSVCLHMSKEDTLEATGKKKGRFWFRLGMILVLLGFLAVIWIGLGLMMEAGLIPYCDLGYTWFAALAEKWI